MDDPQKDKRPNWTLIVALLMGIPNWIMVALMVWFRLHPADLSPSREPEVLTGTGALMTGWFPIVVVSAITTFYMIGLIIVVFRRRNIKRLASDKNELSKANAQLTKNLEDANRTIANLQIRNRALEKQDTTWALRVERLEGELATANRVGAETRSECDRLQRRVNELLAESEDVKQLREIATEQAQAIQDHVEVKCQIAGHKLTGDDQYLDFIFSVSSHCVHPLSVSDKISGLITFGDTRLKHPPELTENRVKNLTINRVAYFELHQPLTESEAARLLSEQGSFGFHGLTTQILNEAALVRPARLDLTSCSVGIDQKFINENYPKVWIEIEPLGLRTYFGYRKSATSGTDLPTERLGAVLNLHVRLHPCRHLRVAQFKLFTSGPIVGAVTGDLKETPHRNSEGRNVSNGMELYPNLADLKIDVERENLVEGWLQFIVPNVESEQMLDPSTFVVRLHVIDESGEWHPQDITGLTRIY
jgi:hypothetical protein